ncbi:hypothetical protein DVH05_001179 [Phytophthora capsici]|nr:hypothetical protein DVH05_001179 [Phytophthora capsici]
MNSPVTNPPVMNSPVTNPPVTNSAVTNPPVTNPPVTNPPVTNPPVMNSPVTNSPVTNSPVTNPPVTNSTESNPPVTNPPVTNSTESNPPVTNPPVTNPPATGTTPPANFAGTYTRSYVLPDTCVVATSCDYQRSAVYTIAVSGSTASIYPTTNLSDCTCEELTANISRDTAAGSGRSSNYSLTLTSSGVQVITSTSGVVCTGSYTKTTTTTTTTTNDGRTCSTASFVGLLASALVILYHT